VPSAKAENLMNYYTIGGAGLVCFEQGVEARSGHGSVTFMSESDASRPERSFATLGQNKRPCEKQAKTGPPSKIINP